MKKLNLLIINPIDKRIHQITGVPKESVLTFLQIICSPTRIVELGSPFKGHDVWIDEEGLYNTPSFGFILDGKKYHGFGVILMSEPNSEGELDFSSCKLSPLDFVGSLEFWVSPKELFKQSVLQDFHSEDADNDLTKHTH